MEIQAPLLKTSLLSSLDSLPPEILKARAEKLEADMEILDAALKPDGFPVFVKHIFPLSVDILKNGVFICGEFPLDIAKWLQENPRTIRVSARDHFKSMSFYAHIMWKILRLYMTEANREINYFSYKESMAGYHLTKIKLAVKCNPYFNGIIDHKSAADSVISYSWNGKNKLTVHPRGLLEFKRGIHCHDVYVDDPFQDPQNSLVPTVIERINKTMKTQILDMFQNELHIAGTAQTNFDFFFDKDFISRFSRRILPAIVNEKEKKVLWAEWVSWEELQAKRLERGERIFNQEYLCSPVYTENAFVKNKERLMTVVGNGKNFKLKDTEEIKKKYKDWDIVGGWDLGKKNHPAHFALFARKEKKRVQIHDHWFDHEDYTEQLSYIQAFVDSWGVYKVYYDATRGELEMLAETGELPAEYEGVHFTFKAKHSMANGFDRAITAKEIELLNVERSINQILIVNGDLKAPTTPEGHGDCFWSICLTFMDSEGVVDIHIS